MNRRLVIGLVLLVASIVAGIVAAALTVDDFDPFGDQA